MKIKKKRIFVQVEIPPDIKESLKKLAKEDGRKMTALARFWIIEQIKKTRTEKGRHA